MGTWVTGSEQPCGIALSSREMPSNGALKLLGYKQTTILPELNVWHLYVRLFFSIKRTHVGRFSLQRAPIFTSQQPLLNSEPSNCGSCLTCLWQEIWHQCAVPRVPRTYALPFTCPPDHLLSLHCLLVAVLHDQLLIEVSSRAKSPHLNF